MVKLIERGAELLKETKSRCPVCAQGIPAEVWRLDDGKHGRVVMRKRCFSHGETEICLSSDARFSG